MKPHPRIRKTIKWGGAAVTVLLVVVWIGSGWWWVRWAGGRAAIEFEHGAVGLRWYSGKEYRPDPEGPARGVFLPNHTGWTGEPQAWYGMRWWVFAARTTGCLEASVPLWPAVAASLCLAAAAWRADLRARRRQRVGRCPKCNYDRTGIAARAVCPECGSQPA